MAHRLSEPILNLELVANEPLICPYLAENLDSVFSTGCQPKELLKTFTHSFSEHFNTILLQLKEEVADFEMIHSSAHTLKGSTGTMACRRLYVTFYSIDYLSQQLIQDPSDSRKLKLLKKFAKTAKNTYYDSLKAWKARWVPKK
eukprot:TRINITY_DN15096_c0_g1_i1.p1 TRINITY_DN15096_c0_g1~~TRINITY_DN15096_c0_g1_i1.p1  ORF type:complete len:156 (-),score=31.90 TRINITY_DN15096_c0_g1_i1:106-537(-)